MVPYCASALSFSIACLSGLLLEHELNLAHYTTSVSHKLSSTEANTCLVIVNGEHLDDLCADGGSLVQPRLDERREELRRVVVVVVNEDGHAHEVGPGVVNILASMQ